VTTAEQTSRRINIKKWLLITAVVLVAAVVLAIAIGFGASKRVSGSSMRPTLHGGDRVLVDTSAYHKHGPSRFDVVALHPPGSDVLAVKRVIGVPGDRVQIRAVDGQPQLLIQLDGKGEWFIADRHRHVDWGPGATACCDNPAASEDSRKFGFVELSAIQGRVTFRIWPPGGIGGRPKLVQLR